MNIPDKILNPHLDFKNNAMNILVVDDSRMQLKLVCMHLKKWGFNPVQCLSAIEALEHCKNQEFDMVISDWMMPDMDGLEFCQKFKAMNKKNYGYFILLTSKSAKEDIAEGLARGADDLLSKPVSSQELLARMQAGRRVLQMEQKLKIKNQELTNTLTQLQTLHEEINKDLVAAERLQMSLIPKRHTTFDKCSASVLFKSSAHVGGDLVGFFQFSPNSISFYSIDVSGHGISSALLTARLAGYLSKHDHEQNIAYIRKKKGALIRRTPAEIASAFNKLLLTELETEHYFTMAFVELDLNTGIANFVQAGHPHPIIVKSDGSAKELGNGGPPIGLIDTVNYTTDTIALKSGDKILLYSDGITEYQNMSEELYGENRLLKVLSDNHKDTGTKYLNSIVDDLQKFAPNLPPTDDISAILLEYTPGLVNDALA